MKQKTSTPPLSWPDTAGAREWIIALVAALAASIFVFLLFSVFMPLIMGKGVFATLELVQGTSFGLMWFVMGMFVGAFLIREKNFAARAKRKRIVESLGAVAIGEATCLTPTILNVPTQVVLVLTRTSFSVYSRRPFANRFECPLSNIAGTVIHQDRSSIPSDSIEITFVENDTSLLGRFSNVGTNSKQWASKITALQEGVNNNVPKGI